MFLNWVYILTVTIVSKNNSPTLGGSIDNTWIIEGYEFSDK